MDSLTTVTDFIPTDFIPLDLEVNTRRPITVWLNGILGDEEYHLYMID